VTTALGESRYRHSTREQKRGCSVICTGSEKSSSGPHRDATDSLLLAVSGRRTVWYAEFSNDGTRVRDKLFTSPTGPEFLPSWFDPSLYPAEEMIGVRWRGPIILEAGDAMWIKTGWWHCILSEANSVAVPLEVREGVDPGTTPCVWRQVARSRRGRWHAGRREPETHGWHSAASVRDLWEWSQE